MELKDFVMNSFDAMGRPPVRFGQLYYRLGGKGMGTNPAVQTFLSA